MQIDKKKLDKQLNQIIEICIEKTEEGVNYASIKEEIVGEIKNLFKPFIIVTELYNETKK